MGFCSTTFLVAVQAGVGWSQRGAATSSTLFMRFVGQAVGAAGFGAILNLGIHRHAPGAGGVIDRLMGATTREGLGPPEIARLADAVSRALHGVYLAAAVLAALTSVVGLCLPAGLGPSRHSRPS